MYGAIFAMPNIRGGGEFGEEWHLAGTRERKVSFNFKDLHLVLLNLSSIFEGELFR